MKCKWPRGISRKYKLQPEAATTSVVMQLRPEHVNTK